MELEFEGIHPFARVTVNGTPLARAAYRSLISAKVSDVAGFASDTAELIFANFGDEAALAMPAPGAELEVFLGYEEAYRSMGVFVADEIEEEGPSRMLSVTCRAKAQGTSDLGLAPIQQQKTRSWAAGLSLHSIALTMAGDNGLTAAVTPAAGAIIPGHIDQVDESDIAVLTRLSLVHDLVAKPAGRRLFIGRRADATTASGLVMPTFELLSREVSTWRMRRNFGEAVGTVIATYRDIAAGKDVEVKVGSGEPVRRIRGRYADASEARAVAGSEGRRSARAVEALDVGMPGNPEIVAETKINPLDFSRAAAGEWVVAKADHSVSKAGYKLSITAERPDAT